MTHKKLQKEVVKQLSVKGGGFNVVSSNRRGVPDIVGFVSMIMVSVECKVGRDTLRPAQRANLNNITDKGGIGLVVHEKHYELFVDYIQLIESQVASHMPCTYIGKPIPPELLADHPKDVLSVVVEAV
jgi:hypothetical protein